MKINKIGLALLAFAVLFIASPFIKPGLTTLMAFFMGWPMLVAGIILLFRESAMAKWRYKSVCAIILRNDGEEKVFDFINYDPNEPGNLFLPENVRKFAYNPEYFINVPSRGWVPGKKDKSRYAKFKRFLFPIKTGFFIFDTDAGAVINEKTNEKSGMVVTHNSADAAYSAVSPELLKMVVESRLAQNFFRSLDRKAINGKMWIFLIIGVVALGVVLKLAGVI